MEKEEMTDMDEGLNFLEYLRIVWKRKFFICLVVLIAMSATVFYSLTLNEIYQSAVVISPISGKEGGGGGGLSSLAQQFGGLPGISLPGSSSASELVNLLKSNILREKVIKKYDLLPVLLYEKWDSEKKEWKKEEPGWTELLAVKSRGLLQKISNIIRPGPVNAQTSVSSDDAPTIWDGLRMLSNVVKVANNVKENTITISVEFYDPEMSAKLLEYLLATLTDHMSSEAKRVARTNRRYLEEQLGTTADPLIRQKIYNLIAQQIETAMMSEVKENFAFKVIDPPKAPDKRIRPIRSQMVKKSLFISLFAAVLLAFFLEHIKKMKINGGGNV